MSFATYEEHLLSDPDFPAIYHIGCIDIGFPVLAHWHENIEILYVIEGSANIIMDGRTVSAHEGQLVINNSRCIHSVAATSEKFIYHCLIIDQRFCRTHGIKVKEDMFLPVCDGKSFKSRFETIHREIIKCAPYYKIRIQAEIISILVQMCRSCLNTNISTGTKNGKRLDVVKQSIEYILEHFTESLSTDDICRRIGYSKYYLCHAFKEATGLTLIEYINLQRCRYAASLLKDDDLTVAEAAGMAGFNSASYFSKTYKKYLGKLPSENQDL